MNNGTWNGSGYSSCLANNTPASIQVAAILMGWRAGDALVAAPSSDPNMNAVWKLIGLRNSFKEIGAMVGYVLMVLSGFLECERTAYYANPPVGPAPARWLTPDHLVDIVTQFGALEGSKAGARSRGRRDLVNEYFSLILGEFYGVVLAAPASSSTVIQNHNAFVGGFVRGMIQGANAMFADLFNAGWQSGYASGQEIGYAKGLAQGYSQGYVAGRQAGFAAADGAGYDSGGSQSAFGGLGTIIDGVGSVLGGVQGILSNAGVVGSVVSTVASLF
jgi:hypothetical protein